MATSFDQYATDIADSTPSSSTPSSTDNSGFNLGGILSTLGGAAQVGLGIFNETQGGPAVNTSLLGGYTAVAGAPVTTRILGFTMTEIFIGLLLIVGVIVAVHFGSK